MEKQDFKSPLPKTIQSSWRGDLRLYTPAARGQIQRERMDGGTSSDVSAPLRFCMLSLVILIREFWMPNSGAQRTMGFFHEWMGLGAGAGVVMVVGGLLVLEGYRWGWVLDAARAVAVSGARRRSG
jgi:hypothetical protein